MTGTGARQELRTTFAARPLARSEGKKNRITLDSKYTPGVTEERIQLAEHESEDQPREDTVLLFILFRRDSTRGLARNPRRSAEQSVSER